ncbi:NHL repeat-containing protein [Edaphobacter aggregans]|uniref:NHL repeat-containing protein n=1 Tax=Edaphobacter aggregans TaxID=570835 RepID=UPI000551A7EC|nr:NHL repeat-containing protein [Edaphobacter aggregans]
MATGYRMTLRPCAAALALAVTLAGVVPLTGCSTGTTAVDPPTTTPPTTTPPTTTPPTPPAAPSLLVSGKVLAGTQPISGASVQVYAAGTTGNGSAATALLASPVTTDASGAFTITSGLNCASTSSMLYLIARGGQVGSAPANAGIALATAMGACSQLSTSTTAQFTVNEVTTVATVWALSQFFGSGGSIGATATNAKGLANAFATAANLADPAAGKSPGTGFPSTGKSPAPKVNALARLLNTCVSYTAAPGSANPCDKLFQNVTVTGSPSPSNTLDAALSLARNAGNNVAGLYTQSTASTAFSPALSSVPSDWTISINFTGGGMNGPTGVGVDGQGNIWVASYFGGVASQFTPTGSPVFAPGITGSGLYHSYGLAIDSQNNVWIPNEDSPSSVNKTLGSVTVLNSAGQAISGADGFTAGGIYNPVAIAIDTNGTAWVVDFGNAHVTLLSSTGAPLSGTSGYTAPTLAFSASVAIDANHNGWIGNQNDEVVTRISADGAQTSGISCCNGAQGIAVDQHGYVWVSNFYGDSISLLSSTGSIISAGYSASSVLKPQGIAIDGAGVVWVASVRNVTGAASATLTQMAGSASASPGQILSPAGGWLADAGMLVPYGVAVDASGNLWITNFGSNILTEVVGLASPVRAPLNGPPQAP